MNLYPNADAPTTIKNQVTLDPISKKINQFSKEDGCKFSCDAFFEFAKYNPELDENSGLQ
jgi:hypothetical protein